MLSLWFLAHSLVLTVSDEVSYDKTTSISVLSSKSYDNEVKQLNQVCVVQLYKSNHAARVVYKNFTQAASRLKGYSKVGVVKCDLGRNKGLCKVHNFTRFPIVQVYKGKELIHSEEMESFDAHDLEWFVKNLVTEEESGIVHLNAGNYKQWLKDNDKLPKAMYFMMARKQSPPLFRHIAFQLKGRMAFAVVSWIDEVVVRHFSTGLSPRGVAVGVVDIADGDDKGEDLETIMFEGDVNDAVALHSWLDDFVLETNLQVEQLVDDSCLDVYCNKVAGPCAIMVISVDGEASGRKKRKRKRELRIWNKAQDASTRQRGPARFTFVWMDGTAQRNFIEQAFGMVPQDHPQVVVFGGRHKRFVSFSGPFSSSSISDFLTKLDKGVVQTIPVHSTSLPSLVGDGARCQPTPTRDKKTGMDAAVVMEDQQTETEAVQEEFRHKFKNPQTGADLEQKSRGYRGGTGVVVLDSKNAEAMLRSAAHWMVGFSKGTRCEQCKEFKHTLKVAAAALENLVKFGWVDCESGGAQLCTQYNVTTFPAVKVFQFGNKHKQKPTNYDGEMKADVLSAYAGGLLRNATHSVQTLTVDSLPSFLREEDLMCPKVIYLTDSKDRPEVPDLMRAISLEYRQGSDADLRFGFANGPQVHRILELLSIPVSKLPLVILGSGGNTDGNAFDTRVLTSEHINFAIVADALDQYAAAWSYNKKLIQLEVNGASKTPVVPVVEEHILWEHEEL